MIYNLPRAHGLLRWMTLTASSAYCSAGKLYNSIAQHNKQTIERNDKRRLFSPNCITQGSSVTRMTSIGPAMMVSMGTDTVVHLRLSPTQNPVQKRGNSTDTLPLPLSLKTSTTFMIGQVPGRPPSRPDFQELSSLFTADHRS